MDEEFKKMLAERDELFKNPRVKAARLYFEKHGYPVSAHPDVPLMAVHKGRLQWLDATDAMIEESMKWLTDRGYHTDMQGAPPLTPESRDADRVSLGKKPLGEA